MANVIDIIEKLSNKGFDVHFITEELSTEEIDMMHNYRECVPLLETIIKIGRVYKKIEQILKLEDLYSFLDDKNAIQDLDSQLRKTIEEWFIENFKETYLDNLETAKELLNVDQELLLVYQSLTQDIGLDPTDMELDRNSNTIYYNGFDMLLTELKFRTVEECSDTVVKILTMRQLGGYPTVLEIRLHQNYTVQYTIYVNTPKKRIYIKKRR